MSIPTSKITMSVDPAKRDVQISKALSYLLRHGAQKENLVMDDSGYVKISDILANNRIKTHRTKIEDIKRIVENNDKKRFTLKVEDGRTYICANQGHSLKSVTNNNLELLSKKSQFPELLIHGTTFNKLKLIKQSGGLNKMNRNHIHLTSKVVNEESNGETKSVSGLRTFSTVLIYLNIDKLLEDKVKVYKSLNDVYLIEGDSNGALSIDYFEKIINRKTGELINIDSI